MAQHGYLHDEYDEGWDRGDDREREWRERSDRDWRGGSDRDRGRDFMFGDRDRERERYRERDRDDDGRGFSRMGDQAREWLGDDEDRRSDRSAWENNRDWPQRGMGNEGRGPYGQGGSGGSNESREGRSRFSAHPDDHYRSWRERQMQSLDRDYQDYCREREQRFHQDFDSWRQNRQQPQGASGQPQSSGQAQQGAVPEEVMELDKQLAAGGEAQGAGTSPTAAATLGTNNSENSTTPRGRR